MGDVRVIGDVGVIELASDSTSKHAGGYLDQRGPGLAAAFLERGLLLRPLGNVLYVMPPYAITDEEATWMMEQIHDVLAQLQPA